MSGLRCGSTFRGLGSDFYSCCKAPHDHGLHVAIIGSWSAPGLDTIWWAGAMGQTPRAATEAEVMAELAERGGKGRAVKTVTGSRPGALNGTREVAIAQGYTGEVCGECGSMQTTRNGSCLLCRECGRTSGCS